MLTPELTVTNVVILDDGFVDVAGGCHGLAAQIARRFHVAGAASVAELRAPRSTTRATAEGAANSGRLKPRKAVRAGLTCFMMIMRVQRRHNECREMGRVCDSLNKNLAVFELHGHMNKYNPNRRHWVH